MASTHPYANKYDRAALFRGRPRRIYQNMSEGVRQHTHQEIDGRTSSSDRNHPGLHESPDTRLAPANRLCDAMNGSSWDLSLGIGRMSCVHLVLGMAKRRHPLHSCEPVGHVRGCVSNPEPHRQRTDRWERGHHNQRRNYLHRDRIGVVSDNHENHGRKRTLNHQAASGHQRKLEFPNETPQLTMVDIQKPTTRYATN